MNRGVKRKATQQSSRPAKKRRYETKLEAKADNFVHYVTCYSLNLHTTKYIPQARQTAQQTHLGSHKRVIVEG